MIETERLLLRLPEPRDLDALHRAYSDADVMRHVGEGTPFSRDQTARTLERFQQRWQLDGYGSFVIELRDSGDVIGEAGLLAWDARTWAHGLRLELGPEIELELGWALARDAWGRGYATEAALAARDWAFRELRPPRLISMIYPANVRSQRVAQKIGEHLERDVVTASGKETQLWST